MTPTPFPHRRAQWHCVTRAPTDRSVEARAAHTCHTYNNHKLNNDLNGDLKLWSYTFGNALKYVRMFLDGSIKVSDRVTGIKWIM